ncbi:MAG: TRAP transporter substrate-binding protein [Clostridiales Family XIII bacterium]|nr:TRAP transporter substrate-binding protein [Clostridiales Family XIII bacterium]
MTKKRIAILWALVLAISLGLTACGGGGNAADNGENASAGGDGDVSQNAAADDTVYEFKMDIPDSKDATTGKFLSQWIEDVKEASNGRIVIKLFPSSQLGAVPDIIDNLKLGVSDIAWASPAMFSGRFPVMEGTNLPLLDIPTARAGTDLLYDLWEQTDLMQKEFEGLHPLMLHNACPYYFASAKGGKDITSLDDLKGMKLRVQGTYPSILIKELGAEPISQHASEVYESLSKRVLDGMLTDITTFRTYKLSEVTGSVVETQIYRFCAFVLMRPEAYDSLPDDLKKVMDDMSGREASYAFSDAWTADVDEGIKLYREAGAKTSAFTDAEIDTIHRAAEAVNAQWISDMDKVGYDGQGILDTYVELLEKINSNA